MYALTAMLVLSLVATGTHRRKVAVLEMDGVGAVAKDVGEGLGLLIPTEVRRRDPSALVLSADDVRAVLSLEKQKENLGCREGTSCITDLGGQLGADEVIAGKVALVGTTYVLELRRVDVQHNKALASSTRTAEDNPSTLVSQVRSMVDELYSVSRVEDAPPPVPTLAPASSTPSAKAARPVTGDPAPTTSASGAARTGAANAAPSSVSSSAAGDTSGPRGVLTPLSYGLLGTGVAGLAVGVISALVERRTVSQMTSASATHRLHAAAETQATVSQVGTAVGVGGLLVGASLFAIAALSGSSTATAALSPAGGPALAIDF